MKVLFSGATGFLGKNIIPLLPRDFDVKTVGRSAENHFQADLSMDPLSFPEEAFDVVIHAAGKAHSVPKTEKEKHLFHDVNYIGTVRLCEALERQTLPKAFVFISSVAVYGRDSGTGIDEDHPLEGDSPYALSKIKAENFLIDWCGHHGVTLSIVRPSLIAGPHPPGNLGAMIRGIQSGKYLSIAGGKARKSVVMVDDIARVIPSLIDKGGIYNLCDDTHPTFSDLEALIASQLGKSPPYSIPIYLARGIAKIGDLLGSAAPVNSDKLDKIIRSLTFSNEKAKSVLGWKPLDVLSHFHIGQ